MHALVSQGNVTKCFVASCRACASSLSLACHAPYPELEDEEVVGGRLSNRFNKSLFQIVMRYHGSNSYRQSYRQPFATLAVL